MKKNYMTPDMEVITMSVSNILAGSVEILKDSGEYNGIPATGKTITFEALENFKVVNGIIVESWGYWPDKQIEEKVNHYKETYENIKKVSFKGAGPVGKDLVSFG